MRTYVVGDIHGGLRALHQCLERSLFNREEDQLIFLGDYVDGWSESAETIEFLIDLAESCSIKPIFLKGNHDEWCRKWLIEGQTSINWEEQGGKATIDSYIRTGYLVKDSHRDFFANMVDYHVDEQNRAFVHGGFHSRKGLGHEAYQSDYWWDRDLWNLALMNHGRVHLGGPSHYRRFEKHSEIFIGHTSTSNWNAKRHFPEFEDENQIKGGPITVPMNRCNVWNIDTGGGWYGKLTIMDIDSKEYWQSDLVKELYPDEKGR